MFVFKQNIDMSFMITRYQGDDPEVIVPQEHYGDQVTMLYDSLFAGHDEITSIVLPETLTCIGGHVFDGCSHLEALDLPEQMSDLMQYAFVRCGIKELKIPDGVERIVPYTFASCAQLKRVYLGRHTKKLYGHAFYDCQVLEEVYLPEGVDYSQAFDDCPNVVVHTY